MSIGAFSATDLFTSPILPMMQTANPEADLADAAQKISDAVAA
ncbi:MAG: hypothetical protein O7G85_09130 [Planctomycetota bacterium]|nr:hypothetical protein [Planctomycetota bacterium]